MRLSARHRDQLKRHVAEQLGHDCTLLLFGSRLSDEARGGDVDLLVQSPRPLPRRIWQEARLAAGAGRLLGGRRVDVLLIDPDTLLLPVHHEALANGVPV